MSGVLSIVATPIGNLEDITLRALCVLRDADYILCEDTRVTSKLLVRHGISAKLKRYDAHASEHVHQSIIADLVAGKNIALVSDAGTPSISDPGVLLVQEARSAHVRIDAIPGPSALVAALSIAGIPGNAFTFLGFIPHKKGRKTFFENLRHVEHPTVFYESPHRIMKTLESLAETLQGGTYRVTIARELTKLHEELVTGSPDEILSYYQEHQDRVRGEFVVIVHPL